MTVDEKKINRDLIGLFGSTCGPCGRRYSQQQPSIAASVSHAVRHGWHGDVPDAQRISIRAIQLRIAANHYSGHRFGRGLKFKLSHEVFFEKPVG